MQPLFLYSIQAGFPSPADDYIEKQLSIDEYLIMHPSSTFFVRISGVSMQNAGICDNDIAVVDRSIRPQNGHMVIAVVNGEFLLKQLSITEKEAWLIPANPNFPKILLTENDNSFIWGVVISTFRKYI